MSVPYVIRAFTPADQDWLKAYGIDQWGAEIVVGHGVIYHPAELPGFVAVHGDARIGQITYHIEGKACEIVTLSSDVRGIGIGSALIAAVRNVAQQHSCQRLWLITTNDNLNALKFYQKRGFCITAVYPNAVGKSREIKPEIPLIGNDGIPIRDEIELAIILP